MKISRFARSRGFTLVETILTVVLMIIALALLSSGVKFVNSVFREGDIIKTEAEVEIVQFEIKNDIRNCQSIISIAPDKLVLQTLMLGEGKYDTAVNNQLFTNFSTLTYEFKQTPTESYLLRTLQPASGPAQNRKLLSNCLTAPIAGNTATYLFQPIVNTVPPYQYVRVQFPLKTRAFKLVQKTLSMEVSRRSHL